MQAISRRALDRLQEHLERYGCEPMREDLVFVVMCLEQIPDHALNWATERYTDMWLSAMSNIENDHKSQNIGRSAANRWLLSVMKKKGLPIPTGNAMKEVKLCK